MSAPAFPPHAYLPGRTPRHAEDLFDAIKAGVREGMSPAELQRTQAWQSGLAFLHQGFFWEAHELLEVVWMQTPPNSLERHLVQAVIQLANAHLKLRMDRAKAARRILARVQSHLDACRTSGAETVMGLDLATLHHWVVQLEQRADGQAAASQGL